MGGGFGTRYPGPLGSHVGGRMGVLQEGDSIAGSNSRVDKAAASNPSWRKCEMVDSGNPLIHFVLATCATTTCRCMIPKPKAPADARALGSRRADVLQCVATDSTRAHGKVPGVSPMT